MQFFAPSFITLVVVGLTSGAAAVCSGAASSIAIGSTANATTTGYTQCTLTLSEEYSMNFMGG